MIYTILKKELSSYLKSPMSYIVLGLFALVTGWIFFNLLITYVQNTQNLPLELRGPLDFYSGVVFKFIGNVNVMFIFIIPILSMNTFSLEFKNRTIEIYYKSPVKDFELVLAKFLSLILFSLLVFSVTILFPVILYVIDVQDFTFVFSSYIAMVLNVFAYCAIGVFSSSLTNNPLTAGLMSFVGIMSFWMISWGINISDSYFLVENLRYISIVDHFERLVRAVFSISDIIFYFSFIFTFLFLTKKNIESRKWRFR